MRVLFVTHNFPRTSEDPAGSFVLRLAVALASYGVRVQVVAPATNELVGHDSVNGIPVFRVSYARNMKLAYDGTMAQSVATSPTAMLAFASLIRAMNKHVRKAVQVAEAENDPIHIVHAHWWIPAGISTMLALSALPKQPASVVTMHGSDVRLARKIRIVHPLMKRVLSSAHTATAVSSWLASIASGIAKKPVLVGPMPVDETLFVPSSSVARERFVLFVGRLNAQKGIADLIEAFSDSRLSDVSLVVVGDGPDKASVSARAQQLGIANRVTWLGTLSAQDIVPLYQSASAVAVPSREEGLGLVAVEAQLCEAAVVAYNSGGITDAVQAEHGGHLVEPGDISGLSSALATLVNDEQLRTSCGLRAKRYMQQRYSSSAVAERYAEWYKDAAAYAASNTVRSTAQSTQHG